jgi:hypothetical protein
MWVLKTTGRTVFGLGVTPVVPPLDLAIAGSGRTYGASTRRSSPCPSALAGPAVRGTVRELRCRETAARADNGARRISGSLGLQAAPAASDRGWYSVDCQSVSQLLSTRPLSELAAGERAEVAGHILRCATCRAKWGLDVTTDGSRTDASGARSPVGPADGTTRRLARDGQQSPEEPGEACPPRDLGGFEILDRLGRGGMGAVFRARQPSMDRIVALKVLSGRAAWDGASIIRFTREAQAAAAVGHPNIIEVYDIDQDRGWHYISMEYIDGGSLADVLRRDGPMEPAPALALMRQVAGALAEAHRIGILHRDIKPSNILLTSRGWVKLADFGLAKRPEVDLSVTRATSALGTPLYMAPEALRGEGFSPRCDLYSLGVTFYQALTGRLPFVGATCAELVAKHFEANPPALDEVAPAVGHDVCRVIHRLLAKDPAERYSSAEELLRDLATVETDVPASQADPIRSGTGAPRVPLVERRGQLRRWGRLAALVAGLGGLVVIGLLVVLSLNGPPPPPGPARTEGPAARVIPALPRDANGWEIIWNGKDLTGWEVVAAPDREVDPCGGQLDFIASPHSTDILWKYDVFPTVDYEVKLEAKRVTGNGAFCHMVFPVKTRHCILVIGGQPEGGEGEEGKIVGLDRVNDLKLVDPNNETQKTMHFERNRWYQVHLRVTREKVVVLIDGKEVINVAAHKLKLPDRWEFLEPFGLGTWQTKGAMREIKRLRHEEQPASRPAKEPPGST